ncbi:MAG: restriction endonuclease subunit S [Flammeovirgaceae bacterium]|nr:restriction endonuclease subunit S [Flammeovirgaceae bacterium]
MKRTLKDIAKLITGLYAKPSAQADTLYLQGNYFDNFGLLDPTVKPQLKFSDKIQKHLLGNGDILFAAKGLNNYGVVYKTEMGRAVASSSFIIVRVNNDVNVLPEYLAWYLSTDPGVKLFHKQLGTTIPSISIAKLCELEVTIPSLVQQHRIVQVQQLRNREKQLFQQLEVQKTIL